VSQRRADYGRVVDLEAGVADWIAATPPDRLHVSVLTLGEIEQGRQQYAQPLPVIDALIAATARVHGMTVVTRNVKDFALAGVQVLNPSLTNR
jgi:hypothetical protein